MGLLKEYRDGGRITHIGLSDVTVEQIERARSVVPVAVVQNEYSLAERKHDDVVDYCDEHGIVFVPFFPLHGEDPPAMAEIAERHGATPGQIRLAWLLKRSPIVVPIPGTLSLEHLKENLAALEIELSDDEFQTLAARR
jgi:aryl-alcohol dehydrogenase-like predicted oxidoreductase